MCICGKVEPLSTCAHEGFFSGLLVFMPGLSLFHVVEVRTCTLVVGRIEPEHTGKYLFCFPEPAEPPQAEAVTVQTAEERSIVYASPGKETVKVLAEGELADLDPDVVVTDCCVGIAREREVSQVGMAIETTEIGRQEIHQHAVRLSPVARLMEVNSFEDGVRVGIVRILAGKHLLHFVLGSRATFDDRFRPGSIGSSGSPQ